MPNKDLFPNKRKFVTCNGSRFKEKFHGVVNPDGTIDLVSDGFEDTQEMIDSFEPETDINNIISRVAAGELDLLNQRQGWYGDLENMPKTYAEMLQVMIDAEKDFNKMPVEIKEKFGFDFKQYMAQAGSDEFWKKLGFDFEKNNEMVVEKESKEGEE